MSEVPLVCLETLALGKTLVTTKASGMKKFKDMKNCIIADADSIKSLRESLSSCLSQEQLIDQNEIAQFTANNDQPSFTRSIENLLGSINL